MSDFAPGRQVTTRVVKDEATWDELQPDWSALFDSCPLAAVPLHFDWGRTWWRIYGAHYGKGGGPRIIAVRRGSRLIAVLPLYQGRTSGFPVGVRGLRFLATGEAEFEEICPDYSDLLCAVGDEAAAVAAVVQAVAKLGWDQLDLFAMPESSPLLGAGGLAADGQVVIEGECPVANLTGGFDAYLQRLSASNRRQARRLIRDAEKIGALLELAQEQQVDEFFDDLVRLHQERWVAAGKRGVFAAPRFTEFHRCLVRHWFPSGRAVLARLKVADEPVAVLYGFVMHSRFELHVTGVRTTVPGIRSPGILAFLMHMRALSLQGVERYDFLRGVSAYKDQLATEQNRVVTLKVWRPTLRAAIYRSGSSSGRAVRKVLQSIWKASPTNTNLRTTKRELAARVLGATGLRSLFSRVVRWSGVLSLNYRRIGLADRSPLGWEIWNTSQDAFDAQVGWLKSHFNVIAADELPIVLDRQTGQHVLITFDDSYRDNYTNAFPILKRHGVPATFFVTTGFIDKPRLTWWDEIAWMIRTSSKVQLDLRPWLPEPMLLDEPNREYSIRTLLETYKALPAGSIERYFQAIEEATGSGRYDSAKASKLWMTWDMIRELRGAGMSIGGQTVNYPVLGRMPRDEQRAEIGACSQRLAEVMGEPMRAFSYPIGLRNAFNADTRDCLREAGVRYAFSYYGGFRRFDNWDDHDIRRVGIEREISFSLFKAMAALPQLFCHAK